MRWPAPNSKPLPADRVQLPASFSVPSKYLQILCFFLIETPKRKIGTGKNMSSARNIDSDTAGSSNGQHASGLPMRRRRFLAVLAGVGATAAAVAPTLLQTRGA